MVQLRHGATAKLSLSLANHLARLELDLSSTTPRQILEAYGLQQIMSSIQAPSGAKRPYQAKNFRISSLRKFRRSLSLRTTKIRRALHFSSRACDLGRGTSRRYTISLASAHGLIGGLVIDDSTLFFLTFSLANTSGENAMIQTTPVYLLARYHAIAELPLGKVIRTCRQASTGWWYRRLIYQCQPCKSCI